MWEHPATQANVTTLRERGSVVIEPAVGRLTGADSGKGRLPDPAEIFATCTRLLARGLAPDLAGRRVVVSAGGTREHLDPVRFLGNRSSGRQGYALASAAVARGAEVVLVSANVETLRARGAVVLEPDEGRLTGADTGKGRLPEPAEIFDVAVEVLARGAATPDLRGRRVVVSAGGTREYLDPVRFLGNRSSGLQGYALARAAASRGAEVTLVSANVALPDPAGVKVVRVETTAQLRDEVLSAAASADAVVMAAAPADFRPVSVSDAKIKKADDGSAPAIELEQNPDILRELAHQRPRAGMVVVGFAAETGDDTGSVLELGRAKLARKGCDLLVVNDVSGGAVFGSPDNEAVILTADGEAVDVRLGSKSRLAHVIWDQVLRRFAS
jgi:phosphopantothenoylcysteine decarboxylase/phosphopantothenate--cysteine ligase